jgi:Aldehyde dehydrogenase family
VGQLVQAAAAKNTLPVTLELGGKSPQLVFADADLEAALPFLVNSGIQNAGQTHQLFVALGQTRHHLVEPARLDQDACSGRAGREKGFEALYGFSTLKTIAIKRD